MRRTHRERFQFQISRLLEISVLNSGYIPCPALAGLTFSLQDIEAYGDVYKIRMPYGFAMVAPEVKDSVFSLSYMKHSHTVYGLATPRAGEEEYQFTAPQHAVDWLGISEITTRQ